jgi:uncharacterized protein (DUF2062 family)
LWLWLAKRWRTVRRRLVAILVAHSGPPMIALGAAIGVFAAVLPLPFLQVLVAVLLATLMGANRLAALTTVWLANPVLFYLDYLLGRAVLHTLAPGAYEAAHISWPDFLSQIRESVFALLQGVFLPMFVGALPLGLVAGGVTYCVVLKVVRYYREKLVPGQEQAA